MVWVTVWEIWHSYRAKCGRNSPVFSNEIIFYLQLNIPAKCKNSPHSPSLVSNDPVCLYLPAELLHWALERIQTVSAGKWRGSRKQFESWLDWKIQFYSIQRLTSWTVFSVSQEEFQENVFLGQSLPKKKSETFLYSNVDKFSGDLLLGDVPPQERCLQNDSSAGSFTLQGQPPKEERNIAWVWQNMSMNTANESSIHIFQIYKEITKM